MRIIAGKYKSIYIQNDKSIKARPTTSAAKEALFNILENKINLNELEILDLFSGTGAIAFEFISRGAKKVTCVDQQVNSVKYIKFQAQRLSMNIKTVKVNAWKFLELTKPHCYDIIFADPPYDLVHLSELPKVIFNKMMIKRNGWLIMEHGKDINFNNTINFIEKRSYSSVNFSFFKVNE